jgi:hypothetical protein
MYVCDYAIFCVRVHVRASVIMLKEFIDAQSVRL